jgi:hypothetical protein
MTILKVQATGWPASGSGKKNSPQALFIGFGLNIMRLQQMWY